MRARAGLLLYLSRIFRMQPPRGLLRQFLSTPLGFAPWLVDISMVAKGREAVESDSPPVCRQARFRKGKGKGKGKLTGDGSSAPGGAGGGRLETWADGVCRYLSNIRQRNSSVDPTVRNSYVAPMTHDEFKRWLARQGVRFADGAKHTKLFFGDRFSVLPRHGRREIPPGTAAAIKKQLGLK